MKKRRSLEAYKEDYNKKYLELQRQKKELDELKSEIDSFRKNAASDRMIKLDLSDNEYDELLSFLAQDKKKVLSAIRSFAEKKVIHEITLPEAVGANAPASEKLTENVEKPRAHSMSRSAHHAGTNNISISPGQITRMLF